MLGGICVAEPKIKRAAYRTNDNKNKIKYISATQVETIRRTKQELYDEIYKGKLYCPTKNCEAKIRHNLPKDITRNSYFSTIGYGRNNRHKNEHISGCPHKIDHIEDNNSSVVSKSDKDKEKVITISPTRAAEIHKRALQKQNRINSKSNTVDSEKDTKVKDVNSGDVSSHYMFSEEEKDKNFKGKARMKYLYVQDLNDVYVGQEICVIAYCQNPKIETDYAYINAKYGNKRFYARIDHHVIKESEMEYNIFIDNLKKSHQKKFSSIGVLQKVPKEENRYFIKIGHMCLIHC